MDAIICPGDIRGRVEPPSSKSYAQRALAAALLCDAGSETTLRRIEFCDDTRSALRCIEALGAAVHRIADDALTIRGALHRTAAGCMLRPGTDRLDVGESGLSSRLFTPVSALCDRPVRIEGRGSLLHRPMDMMLAPMRALGAEAAADGGHLPVEVCGPLRGGQAEIDGSVSSQFITGLLLALPLAAGDTTLYVRDAVSTPYLDMTIDAARRFGVEIFHNDYTEFYIPGGQRYGAVDYAVEGDWSAAAMLLAAGAVAGEVTVCNVPMLSKQADTAVCTALARAGAAVISEAWCVTAQRRPLRAFEFDATHCPDLFPALAALAAACEGVSVLRGTTRLVHKESDRCAAIREQYGRLGIEVDTSERDVMRIRGGAVHGARVDACGDHRMAMSLAVSALRADGPVEIAGVECVAKSYPTFFDDLERIRVR